MSTIDLGTFKVTNRQILVTDPCYTSCDGQVSIGDAVNGQWQVTAYSRPGLTGWGPDGHERVMSLTATAGDVPLDDLTAYSTGYYADVDSGALGIFNFEQYLPLHEEIREMSRLIASNGEPGASVGFGAFSNAGYGDGTYPVTLYINEAGLVAGIKVSFDLPVDEEADDE
jgi:hypothetical protein